MHKVLHPTKEDEHGWYSYPSGHRNLLNHSNPVGRGRIGTLGSRVSAREYRNRATRHNPRIGKVQPPAPPTKRTKLMAAAEYGETWQTTHSNHTDTKVETVYHLDGQSYGTWEEWNEAVAAKG